MRVVRTKTCLTTRQMNLSKAEELRGLCGRDRGVERRGCRLGDLPAFHAMRARILMHMFVNYDVHQRFWMFCLLMSMSYSFLFPSSLPDYVPDGCRMQQHGYLPKLSNTTKLGAQRISPLPKSRGSSHNSQLACFCSEMQVI